MKNINRIVLFGIIFLLIVNYSGFGDFSLERIRFKPLGIATYLKTQKNPPLDKYIEASLLFSGVDEASVETYINRLNMIVSDVRLKFNGKPKTKELADELLLFLHDTYLKKYQEKETRMDVLLDKGIYNCVSSSVFYVIAATALDIPVFGVKTDSHAFCVVTVNGKTYDVETTSKYGFDPHGKREFQDEFGEQTGYVYVPPSNYDDRTSITKIQLLSLILNNCIAFAGEYRKYDEAFNCAVDMFEVEQSDVSFQVLSGTLSNISVEAIKLKKYEDGLEVMDRAVFAYREFSELSEVRRFYIMDWAGALINANDPDKAEEVVLRTVKSGKITQDDLRVMQEFIAFKRAELLSKRGDYHLALEVIEDAIKLLGKTDELAKAHVIYTKNTVVQYITAKEYDKARALLETAKKENRIDKAVFEDLLVFFYQKKAEVPAKVKNYNEALAAINEGLSFLPGNPKLYQSGSAFGFNYVLDLLNTKKYNEAGIFLSDIKSSPYLEQKKRNDLWVYFYTDQAGTEKTENGYFAAAKILEQGIERIGLNSQLVNNYEIYIHNGIVGLINEKEFDKAQQILIDALRVLPKSSRFKTDLDTVMKMK